VTSALALAEARPEPQQAEVLPWIGDAAERHPVGEGHPPIGARGVIGRDEEVEGAEEVRGKWGRQTLIAGRQRPRGASAMPVDVRCWRTCACAADQMRPSCSARPRGDEYARATEEVKTQMLESNLHGNRYLMCAADRIRLQP